MRAPARRLMIWTLAALTAATAGALAQTTPAPKSAQAPAAAPAQAPAQPKAATAPKPAAPDVVLATVNNEPIRRSEILRLLGQLSVRPGDEQRAYDSVVSVLVNNKLLGQFLASQRIAVPPAEIDQVVAQYEKNAKDNNSSLINELSQSGMTIEELRDLISKTLQWKKYVEKVATEAELKKYAEQNRDVFNGTRVRASHILVQVKPDASEAEKQEARKKLEAIRDEIAAGKISFADAANKHSEDPGNKQTPNGGDLNFFLRKEPFIESFSAAAFGLKKGEMSQPVETEYGFHLIQVTDRAEGQPLDFAKEQAEIQYRYAQEMQTKIVEDARKKAEAAGAIKIEPMPAGLVPTAAPAPAPAAAPAPAPAATKGAAPKS